MYEYKMVDVDLEFARQTLKEVEEWRSKMKSGTAFQFEYRDAYTEDLYYVIDSIGKNENRVERARIQQVVRESIEAAEKDIKLLVRQKLNEVDDPPEGDIVPKVIQTRFIKPTSSKGKGKPWLPRVALLPPRRVALEQKLKEKEVNTSIVSNIKPKLPLKKPKTLSELMQGIDKSLQSDKIMRIGQISLSPNLQVKDLSVQTFEKDRVLIPTPRPKRQSFKENCQRDPERDLDRAILISSPIQLDRAPKALRDRMSFSNILPRKLIKNASQSNVAVINIIKDEYFAKQLSVQVLPSISIECEMARVRRNKNNFQLIVEKDLSSNSSIDKNSIEEIKSTKEKRAKETEEPGTVETSHTSTQTNGQTKNVSTSVDQNDETLIQKLPLDTITVRQLLRNLITALKEDENGQKKPENVKEGEQDLIKPRTESRGVSTDSFEQKSQFVSMEIETRSQGCATNEKYSKTQQVQVQIDEKEYKDATVMAEETKEVKDACILAKNMDTELKEIGIQTVKLLSERDENANIKSTEEKSTGIDSPIRSDSDEEESSDSAQSPELKKVEISNREIGIQVQVSSSGSSLSTFNESSSVLVSSSTNTTSSSALSTDELISEGEIIFKRPFPPLPRSNQIITQKSSELEVTPEFEEENSSASEGETLGNAPRQLESAQSIGEINLDEIKSENEGNVLEITPDGESCSSGEMIISRQ